MAVYIIAEIGINHDGDLSVARKLIEQAAEARIDAVKFQYRNLENAYFGEPAEIGDEILIDEIRRTHLSAECLLGLRGHAASLGLDVGVSVFDAADLDDFGPAIAEFDFLKVPSAEMANDQLVDAMVALGAHVYLSTGCQTEAAVEAALGRLGDGPEWTPLHCVSNYPTALINARLGQIAHLSRRWRRPIGFSSHDRDWEVCLLAMQMGATVIERHLTHDRDATGLDHSTSSPVADFARLRVFADAMPMILSGDGPRAPNQGELMNRQNLGRSFYAAEDLPLGAPVPLEKLAYRAPNVGLSREDLPLFESRALRAPVRRGQPLQMSDFVAPEALSEQAIETARRLRLSLPVRLHDLAFFANTFPIGAYEFHLSYKEVLSGLDPAIADPSTRYSVHLPDYVNSTQLIDPFSKDEEQRRLSRAILDTTAAFAAGLSERTGVQAPIVGSFSVVPSEAEGGLTRFYDDHAALFEEYRQQNVLIAPQWLPPIAWYFGGSVALQAMNTPDDAAHLCARELPFCLDICHMLLGRNLSGFDLERMLTLLEPHIAHIHLADALGVDGEGVAFGEGDPGNLEVIGRMLTSPKLKVIEVWQGHLDRGARFREAIRSVTALPEQLGLDI